MIGAIVAGSLSAGTPPVTNSYESISTVTVGSGGSSTVTFSSIPSTYKHLQIRSITKGTGAEDGVLMYFNGDTGSNYNFHGLYGTGSAVGAEGGGTRANIPLEQRAVDSSATSVFAGGVLDILDYANTSKNKTTRSLAGYDRNGSGFIAMGSGLWMSTAAINSITFITSATSFAEYTTFALYGIKG